MNYQNMSFLKLRHNSNPSNKILTRNIKAALILFKSFNNKKLFFIFKKKNFLQFLLSCLASDEFSPYGKNFHSMSETTKENHLFLTL